MCHETVTLRYIDLDDEEMLDILRMPKVGTSNIQNRALNKLGITPQPDELPLQAYLRVMHAENGLEPVTPADRRISDAILENGSLSRFVWFLA